MGFKPPQTKLQGALNPRGVPRSHGSPTSHGVPSAHGSPQGFPRPNGVNGRTALWWAAATLGAVLLAFGLRVVPTGGLVDLPVSAQDLVTLSLAVFVESLPFVVLGTFASILVQIWIPARWLERLLPRTPVLRRAALSLLGVVLPVCECGNVPLARGLIVRGFTPGEAVTFLLAAPVLNPVTILTTYHAFGWDSGILVARVLGGFLIANLLGWWLSSHPSPSGLLTPSFRASCEHAHEAHQGKVRASAEAFVSETGALLPALAIGSLLAGAIQVGVPRDVLVTLGSHPLWSVLALLALAFVVSICSSVDAFFILALSSSFLPGSIVGFLLFGAMMDIKMIALLRTTFTGRTIALLAVLTALCAGTVAWAVNLLA